MRVDYEAKPPIECSCKALVSHTLAGFNPELRPICPYCKEDL